MHEIYFFISFFGLIELDPYNKILRVDYYPVKEDYICTTTLRLRILKSILQ